MPLMLLCSAYERMGNLQSDGQPTYILVYKDKWLRTEVGFAYAMTLVRIYIICLRVLRIIIFATATTQICKQRTISRTLANAICSVLVDKDQRHQRHKIFRR
jgi:hypothetical protein